jgi:hypothetical protein
MCRLRPARWSWLTFRTRASSRQFANGPVRRSSRRLTIAAAMILRQLRPARPRSSQSSQDTTGATAGGEALRLSWLIRATWSIRGTGWALRNKALLRRVRGQRRAWISAAVPPALLPVKICRLRFAGWAGRPRLPGRCHLVPVLASTLRHRPGQARRANRGIRIQRVPVHGTPYTHVTLECSRGAHDPPQNLNQPRRCDGSGGCACRGRRNPAR